MSNKSLTQRVREILEETLNDQVYGFGDIEEYREFIIGHLNEVKKEGRIEALNKAIRAISLYRTNPENLELIQEIIDLVYELAVDDERAEP